MKRKIYISSSVVVVAIIIAYFLFVRNHSQAYNFKFDKVSQGDLTVFITATGTINAVTSVDVGTQVSGIIAKLYADFNSVVKKGQLIAQIDPTFLIQSVKDAEANLDKARAQYADSKRNYEREKVMLERGLDSQLNYDAALTTYESNEASLKSAQASLDRAKINLSYATIYAPIDGVVINRAVNIGQTVAASFSSPTLFTIANDLKKCKCRQQSMKLISEGSALDKKQRLPSMRTRMINSQVRCRRSGSLPSPFKMSSTTSSSSM
jgi:HlyD family secretion protein